ncbi:MAG: hypothetical protein ABIO63_04415 [Casimicrobiaceae bacterium]
MNLRLSPASWFSRRTLWHSLGVLAALVLAILLLQAYRQPDLMMELSNLRLCGTFATPGPALKVR